MSLDPVLILAISALWLLVGVGCVPADVLR